MGSRSTMKFLASFFALTAHVYASPASLPSVPDVRPRDSGSCPATVSALEGNLLVDASGELVSGSSAESDRIYPLVNFVELGGAWIKNVLLDTGSSIPWVYHSEAPKQSVGVDPVVPEVNFSMSYRVGSTYGTVRKGPVKIGNVDLGQISIGYAEGHEAPDMHDSGINGIIGLSFPDTSAQGSTNFSTGPVLAKIPFFSVATTIGGGIMQMAWDFGGINRNRIDPAALVSVPVQYPGLSDGTLLAAWAVKLDAVSYGNGQSQTFGNTDYFVLVDSGTPVTLLPRDTVLSIYRQVGKEGTDWRQDSAGTFWLSIAAGDSFKDIVFDLGNGRQWVQSGKNFAAVNGDPQISPSATEWYKGSVQVQPWNVTVGTLGKTFFAHNVVAFDSRGATVTGNTMHGCAAIRVAPVVGST